MTDQPGPPHAPPSQRPDTAAAVAPPAGPDWTDQVADLVVDTVDKVRSRTTGPVLDIARGSVYAVVALIVLLPVAILAAAGAVRLLNWALPGDVWVAYAVLAGILLVVGSLLWSRRRPPTPSGGRT